jgi:transposase-like protein
MNKDARRGAVRATTPKKIKTKPSPTRIAAELNMPDEATIALAELAGAAREGLLALAVATGLQVMDVVMDENVNALCGPKGRHDPDREALRHGHEAGSVILGGRRIPVRRPRVRAVDGSAEVAVPAYEYFSSTELLSQMALERMLAGLSTRRYQVGLEPVGADVEAQATGTSRSAVSRRFVALTQNALDDMLAADLSGLDLVAVMIDGVGFAEHLCVVALGIDSAGVKHPLGLIEGSTENARVVTDLLADLSTRGLDTARPTLVVIDGAKALAAAVKAVFDKPLVARCQEHKIRNVKGYLPERERAFVERKMRAAYRCDDPDRALADLEALASSLKKPHPGAAASLREGLAETLTVLRLGVGPTLRSTLRSTNPIESMIEICRAKSRNVKRWRDGDMALRWCAAGMVEAGKQFRRVKGFREIPKLRAALDAHFAVSVSPTRHTEEVAA